MAGKRGVLIIYTGGTIGMVPKDRDDPTSPLEPASLDQILDLLPNYDKTASELFVGDRWIRIGAYSWPKPIDSSNITLADWIEMARVVKEHYDDYEGFVILHGTDTMAYTSSALTFMLENLNKPVIITGSQLPIAVPRSDAVQNFLTSIEVAAAMSLGGTVIPEVAIFFRDSLLRGCRATKLSTTSFSGFASPNFPPLARVGDTIEVNTTEIFAASAHALRVVDTLEPNIASIDIFPGMSTNLLRNILCKTGLRGVVLQTFGAGNAPNTEEFLEVISEAIEGGTMIVGITQCNSGGVELGLYEVSAGLLARGVVSGLDMTAEAALTKMFVILGSEQDIDIATDKMQLNLKGEQQQSIFNLHFPAGEFSQSADVITVKTIRPMVGGLDRFQPQTLQHAVLRIMGLEPLYKREGRFEFRVYIDLPDSGNLTEEETPYFLGRVSKQCKLDGGVESVFINVTSQARRLIDNRHEITLSLVNTGEIPFKWSRLQIACFADC
jgi:L-asparaginase